MSELPTARDYLGLHRVDVVYPHCDRWQGLNLAALVAAGQGDVPLVALRLRCAKCGQFGHKVIVIGKSYGLEDGC